MSSPSSYYRAYGSVYDGSWLLTNSIRELGSVDVSHLSFPSQIKAVTAGLHVEHLPPNGSYPTLAGQRSPTYEPADAQNTQITVKC